MKRIAAVLALTFAVTPLFGQSFTSDQILAKLDEKAKVFTAMQASVKHQGNSYGTPLAEESGTLAMTSSKGDLRVLFDIKQPTAIQESIGKGKAIKYDVTDNTYQEVKYDPKSDLLSFLLLGFGTPAATIKKGYKAEAKGMEMINGVNAAVLALTSIDVSTDQFPLITLWMDPATWTPVQLRVGQNAKKYHDYKYSGVKLNGKVPDSALDLKMKSGAKKQ
jgi:outer membrane lipoprotein-sorting protein